MTDEVFQRTIIIGLLAFIAGMLYRVSEQLGAIITLLESTP